jgi:predicted DNA binding protein
MSNEDKNIVIAIKDKILNNRLHQKAKGDIKKDFSELINASITDKEYKVIYAAIKPSEQIIV